MKQFSLFSSAVFVVRESTQSFIFFTSSRVISWAFQAFDALRTSCWGIMNVRNMKWTLSSCFCAVAGHFVILPASVWRVTCETSRVDIWQKMSFLRSALQLNSYDYILKIRPEKSGQCVSYSLFVHSMDAFQWTHKHKYFQWFWWCVIPLSWLYT